MTGEKQTVIRSIFKGWPWILGAAVVAATAITLSLMATPEVFRTSVEIQVLPPSEPELWKDRKALKKARDAEGRKVIAVVMGGEVKEAVGRVMGAQYGLDMAAPGWPKGWTEVWESRVMAAGPVDGQVFLVVDDEDGERGAAMAQGVVEALETEWRHRAGDLRIEEIAKLARLIDQDMVRLTELVEQCSNAGGGGDAPRDVALEVEREYVARDMAALGLRRRRLESSRPDDPLPWIVLSDPLPFEHHIRQNPSLPIILSALAFVLLVAVGWVAWDKGTR